MKLYVIRHGETDMGQKEIIASEEELLNNNGIEQALKLGNDLKNIKIDKVYCSPIKRARDTLKHLKLDSNIPVVIEDRLRERNMGKYTGYRFKDLDWKLFWSYNSEIKYKELESMKDVFKRVSSFIEELRLKENDKTILVITHGGTLRAINWYFNGLDNNILKCENCKIYEYDI